LRKKVLTLVIIEVTRTFSFLKTSGTFVSCCPFE
jgi:hypothetical protein